MGGWVRTQAETARENYLVRVCASVRAHVWARRSCGVIDVCISTSMVNCIVSLRRESPQKIVYAHKDQP